MRNVPIELKQKLLKQFYGKLTDNLPKIQVVAKQASINTLITEIIHEDIPANFGDVAIRQLPGEIKPSLAYAACIDNGIGNIYSRKMPAFAEQEWTFVWSLGSVNDIAIEFDGKWKINPRFRYYELFTEEVPYIFFTDSTDTLYVQKWDDESTRILLAESASHLSVCRGWQSTLDTGIDQGLIIGYIRDGKVFYRSYCQQSTGQYIWEPENEVTELGSGNSTLCVFRTNDFRVGFLTENNGEMKYVLSYRTYAGQSMPAENAKVNIVDAQLLFMDATMYHTVMVEKAKALPDNIYLGLLSEEPTPLSIVNMERIGKREIVITFSRPVGGKNNVFHNYYTATPNISVSDTTWQNTNQLKISFSEDLAPSLSYEMTVSECREAWQLIENQNQPFEAMEIIVPGKPYEVSHIQRVEVRLDNISLTLVDATTYNTVTRESAVVSINSVSLELKPVGINPI
ncbi:MAG: Ig-like domain-containing protein [Eubacteriales bacterium]|nr:Ig-like domain-containing protein [Eubacteriales bacterium]